MIDTDPRQNVLMLSEPISKIEISPSRRSTRRKTPSKTQSKTPTKRAASKKFGELLKKETIK